LIVSVFVVSIFALSGMLFGQRVVDLDRVWGDMRVLGDDAGDDSGFAVASGDINGDGYKDIIIGAFRAAPGGRSSAGEVYVIFGSSNPPSTYDMSTTQANITIYGDDTDDYCGYALASGDVNGDGYHDIIIGAWFAKIGIRYSVGETYVIFGSSNPPSIIDLNIQSADITVYGDDEFDSSGWSVASGDVNGDNYDDVIIGAYCAEPGGRLYAGETYVVFGSSSPPATIDLNTQPANITIYGDDAFDHCGSAVASGDVNGDGYDDIIIGADGGDPPGGNQAGETYVIFGSSFSSPPYIIDLSIQSADITVYGDDYGDYSGQSVASGDVTGDGYDDIIIGGPEANYNKWYGAGKTYVIFGSSSPPATIDLDSQSADITIYGDDADDESGRAVASGDVNGDGYHDIIIGAPGADRQFPGLTLYNVGETYVIFGSSSPPSTVDLNTESADIIVYGEDGGDDSGWGVASGDVNNDGYDDIIIGAPWADPGGRSSAGETYLILGGGPIGVAHGEGGNSWIGVWDTITDTRMVNYRVFGDGNTNGEVYVAWEDVDGDGEKEGIFGHGYGGSSWVKIYDTDGTVIFNRKVFGSGNTNGEVHVGARDVDGDGADEIICGQGRGGASWVKVLELNGTVIFNKKVFGGGNTQGEVHVAGGDVDGDGVDEIICGHGRGGSSWVKVYKLGGSVIFNRKVFGGGNTQGDVNVAAGDVDGDGDDEIICAHGFGGSSWVKVLQLDGSAVFNNRVFGAGNTNGEVHVAGGNIGLDRTDEILCGQGFGASSWVKVFELDGTLLYNKRVFGGANTNGEVHVGCR